MWKLEPAKAERELRVVFVDTLRDLMTQNDKIVALEADLGGASGFTKLKETHPDRFIQVGIAEANMVGVAAGLSLRGYTPYLHTFAPFSTRRALDQIYLEGAYAQNTLHIYGSDPGVCVAANGGTHNTFEDIAIMRSIPTVTVLAPADEVQMEWAIREVSGRSGVHYLRANRKANPRLYAPGSTFEVGKGNVLCEGSEVLLLSMGEMLAKAYDAAQQLRAEGISVEVIDAFSLKPFDADLVRERAKGKKLVVTFENHNVLGGLGSCVAEVLAEMPCEAPLVRVGVNDAFGQVGTMEDLCEIFGLTEEHLMQVIRSNVN